MGTKTELSKSKFFQEEVKMKIQTKKQLTVLLAALTMAAPQIGSLVPVLQNTPLGAQTAEAQKYRRGRDYRDDDLNRMNWITRRGQVTNNPSEDYLEMRAEDGQNFRVVARNNVSLRNIDRNDRIEVYGKRDNQIIIAYKVTKLRDSSNTNNRETVRGTIASDLRGDRFLIRINNNYYTVIERNGERNNIRKGREVEATGYWKDGVFYADRVRVTGYDNNNDNDYNERSLQGRVVSDNDNRRFSLRLDNGRMVNVVSDERTPPRLSRGDYVAVEGRWDRNRRGNARDNVFRADRVRILSNNGNNSNETRVDFRGEIIRATQNGRSWDYVVRSNRRDYLVRFDEKFRIGDRVRVVGVLRNGRVTATDIDRA
jgi:uncharacterized protein YdeI (BOF family)